MSSYEARSVFSGIAILRNGRLILEKSFAAYNNTIAPYEQETSKEIHMCLYGDSNKQKEDPCVFRIPTLALSKSGQIHV